MKRISSIAKVLFWIGIFTSGQSLAQTLTQGSSNLLETAPQSDVLSRFQAPDGPALQSSSVQLSPDEADILKRAKLGGRVSLPSLDALTDNKSDPLRFKRIELYARTSQITIVGKQGNYHLTPSARSFFMATNSTTTIGLALNRGSGSVEGYAMKGDSRMNISGKLSGPIKMGSAAGPEDGDFSCGTELDEQPPDATAFLKNQAFNSLNGTTATGGITWQTTVAVDTDTEWMAGKGNSTTTATNWIEALFLSMNVMYERDLSTRLLIGDVILRTGSDPYTVNNGDTGAMLDEWAEYWRLNQQAVDRDFAVFLSGKISSNSFSGIAWVNQYCVTDHTQGSRTVGSYSMNRIGTAYSANAASKLVGHELGHNLGSPHTHCISNGSGGFVDNCYNGGGSGCYSGTESCPAAGSGTTMSYCHILGGCGSTSDFHPVVQTLLGDRLVANNPSCIDNFENPDPPSPSIAIVKEISVNGGANWFDANSAGAAPNVEFPSGAQYRITVTNNGGIDLVNVSVSDSTLGVSNYDAGSLVVDASVVLDSGDISALAVVQACNSTITVSNTASVSAQSADDASSVGPETDQAFLNCAAPPSLALTKEISINNGVNWDDADGAGSAPVVQFPSGADYRVTIQNNGNVALNNVRLNDPSLSISNYNAGSLGIGASVVLDSDDIAALSRATACNSAATVINTASASAQSAVTGTSTGTQNDSAYLVCVAAPSLIISKQISVNGGVSWADADTLGNAVAVEFPSTARYRMTINNNGAVDLVNVEMSDADLSINNYAVGSIASGTSVVVDSDDIGTLNAGTVCTSTQTVSNTASASGESAADGSNIGPVTDSTYLVCAAPPSVAISKEISIDNGDTWLDADSAGTAPKVLHPAGADYRITVTNDGNVNLENVTLNDSALGISNYGIGNLSTSSSVQLDGSDLPALSPATVCNSAITVLNTASADGQSAVTGNAATTANNAAYLVCEDPVPPLFIDSFE